MTNVHYEVHSLVPNINTVFTANDNNSHVYLTTFYSHIYTWPINFYVSSFIDN